MVLAAGETDAACMSHIAFVKFNCSPLLSLPPWLTYPPRPEPPASHSSPASSELKVSRTLQSNTNFPFEKRLLEGACIPGRSSHRLAQKGWGSATAFRWAAKSPPTRRQSGSGRTMSPAHCFYLQGLPCTCGSLGRGNHEEEKKRKKKIRKKKEIVKGGTRDVRRVSVFGQKKPSFLSVNSRRFARPPSHPPPSPAERVSETKGTYCVEKTRGLVSMQLCPRRADQVMSYQRVSTGLHRQDRALRLLRAECCPSSQVPGCFLLCLQVRSPS
ncbi:hypothetical protein B0I35DRAFT_273068 [Stachybotrys elegans]|uniref:Uncharacterized protein n=1 Tax=Stachybotrys elegans TaxID=80388 RepID=A0A8K0SKV4_9HYPO|nr:hypothetical protein B0I35DRAFT_273068 [Stachybotrys elegans]